MKKLQKENLVLGILIMLSVLTMVLYGSRKEGYHVDEIYSYGLANTLIRETQID